MAQTQSLFSAQNKTIAITVTASSSAAVDLPGVGNTIRVVNPSTAVAFFCISVAGTAATVPTSTPLATATPIGPGVDATFSIPNTANTGMTAATPPAIGAVYPAATPLKITTIGTVGTTLYVQVGEGE